MTITCGHIAVTIDDAQEREIEYLARWHADLQYIIERYGKNDPECDVSRKSIECSFDRLDALRVPYWLQNAALAFSENWRRYLSMSFWDYLKNLDGYTVEA